MSFFTAAIPNTISAIRVGYISKMKYIITPTTKNTRSLLNALQDCGVISAYERCNNYNIYKQYYKIFLCYKNNKPTVTQLKLLSKGSKKYYITAQALNQFMITRRGVMILSTSRGVITNTTASKLRVGGLCLVWILY